MKCRYCSADYQGDICPDCGTPAGMDRPPHQQSASSSDAFSRETPPRKTNPPLRPSSFSIPDAPQVISHLQQQKPSWLRNVLIVAGAVIAAMVFLTVISSFFEFLEDSSQNITGSLSYSITASKEFKNAVQETETEVQGMLPSEEYGNAGYEADSFRGFQISTWAQVLYDPEITEEGCYFSFRTISTQNSEEVLYGVAFWPGDDQELYDGKYLFLTGTILGEYSYKDSYGYEDIGPGLYITDLQLSSYAEIFSPAMVTLTPQVPAVSRGGCTMELERIEFAETETRFYFTVDNQSDFYLTFYLEETSAFQDSRKYHWQENYESDNTILYDGVAPGEKREVFLTFPPMSDRWTIDLSVYVDSAVSKSPFRFRIPGETPPTPSETPGASEITPLEPAPSPESSLPADEEGKPI